MLAVAAGLAACGGSAGAGWTTAQGESIGSVRGLTVDVRRCEGVGEPDDRRYRRLACIAGARHGDVRFDTVAVTFEVVPRNGGYRLEEVRFFGGPGIP